MNPNYENEEWFELPYENCFISKNGVVKKTYKSRPPKYTLGKMTSVGYLATTFPKYPNKINIHTLMGKIFLPNPNNLKDIDHIDRNKTNNKLSNLRRFSRSDNALNRSNLSGIFYNEKSKNWISKSSDEVIGYFKTEDEARACKYGYLRAKGITMDNFYDENL